MSFFAGIAGVLLCSSAFASDPASQDVTIPATPGVITFNWTGTVPAAPATGQATNSCDTDPTGAGNDVHTFKLTVPDGLYQSLAVKAEFKITWKQTGTLPATPAIGEDALPDMALTVQKDGKTVTSSDHSTTDESVGVFDPTTATYTTLVCMVVPDSSPSTAYDGTLTLKVISASDIYAPPSANAQGLEFSASLADELQAFESEPLVTLDRDGTIYTCGPAGSAYPAADFGQASLDGGDQFNRLGDPSTGRMGLMGGGDCAMATGIEKNAQGNYQLAYAGLSNLLQFTVSTSPDKGQTLTNSPMSSTAPQADRQWLAFIDAMTVFMNYNGDGGVVIQKSTDGGLTYSPQQIISPNPFHVGPIHSMTKDENPAHNGMVGLYYPYTSGNAVAMAYSADAGATWNNCTVTPTKGNPNALFAVIDHDVAGNLYAVYTDQADFNAYMVVVPAAELAQCKGGSGTGASIKDALKTLPPIQMNREKAVTTVMPWITAGGAPGRAAVAFYASPFPAAADDATAPHVWDVYVSQTLNALDANPAVAQVKVTTHPMHYDQICIGGTGCITGGDRTLADFLSVVYNPTNHELDVVFNQSAKKPGDGSNSSGTITATTFARQIDGPSNGGGTVARNGRQVLRQSASDPAGDAYGGFSDLFMTPTRVQLPALDLAGVSVDPALDLKKGTPLDGGGFTVTLQLKDLSPAALSAALSQSGGRSLLWMFYYWDGYAPSVALATWDSASGFAFGNGGAVQSMSCLTPSQATVVLGCDVYPAATPIDGKVDQAAGTIQMTLPLAMLHALADVPGPARSPAQVDAKPGDRLYSAAAYSFANLASSSQALQQALLTVDNTPAMDFQIPGGTPVVVNNPPPAVVAARDTNRFGGALGFTLLLPMFGVAAWRRRRK